MKESLDLFDVAKFSILLVLSALIPFFAFVAIDLYAIRPVVGYSSGLTVVMRTAGLVVGPMLLLLYTNDSERQSNSTEVSDDE